MKSIKWRWAFEPDLKIFFSPGSNGSYSNQDKCDFCHLGKDQFSSSVGAKEVGGGGGEGRGRVEGEGDACVVSARAAVEGGRGNGCVGIISKEATLRVIMSMTLE